MTFFEILDFLLGIFFVFILLGGGAMLSDEGFPRK